MFPLLNSVMWTELLDQSFKGPSINHVDIIFLTPRSPTWTFYKKGQSSKVIIWLTPPPPIVNNNPYNRFMDTPCA